MGLTGVSVVIPIFNEEANLADIIDRLKRTLEGWRYELIFVDDRSTDNSIELLSTYHNDDSIVVLRKTGKKGKAFSLQEGFAAAHYHYIAMIDGDLQYPPESIPEMIIEMIVEGADIIVGRRIHHETITRSILSKTFRQGSQLFIKDIDVDIQSGLKVFKKSVIDKVSISAQPWTFDFEFLLKSRNSGYKIASYNIDFQPRLHGRSKVKIIPAAAQIIYNFIKTLYKTPKFVKFDTLGLSMGSGFYYVGKPYTTHSTMSTDKSAVQRFTKTQILILCIMLAFLVFAFWTGWHATLVVLISVLTMVYFIDLSFNLFLIYRSYNHSNEITIAESAIQSNYNWPKYTILCPLYKEGNIISQFIKSMEQIQYPPDKLEVLLLLEEDDEETIATTQAMFLPSYFKIIVVPHSQPKTKPKACNYGLTQTTGEYAVIYDAEDIPDPLQLKKAVLAFQVVSSKVGCLQAKLNYYNTNQNILTRLFTLEYSLWFDLILTGLQSINAPIPLGGTSNHFRVKDLLSFEGWDPFNVTEDADLGIRLKKQGYTTLILDSTTLEEANSQYKNWIRQRSRWIKGYIQTYFVHIRRNNKQESLRDALIFQLVIGGKVLSSILNPIFWIATIIYFSERVYVGHFIHGLFPTPIYYISLIALVGGNFLYMYYYMMGAAKRKQYELIPYGVIVPFYWMLISVAAYKAVWEFIISPFYWQKTHHGLHLTDLSQQEELSRIIL